MRYECEIFSLEFLVLHWKAADWNYYFTHHLLELLSVVLSCHFDMIELVFFLLEKLRRKLKFQIFFGEKIENWSLLLWISGYHLWHSGEVTLFYLNDFKSGALEQFPALGVTSVNFEGGGSRIKTWRTLLCWLRRGNHNTPPSKSRLFFQNQKINRYKIAY